MVRCTWRAAAKVSLPAWLALITQGPTVWNVTTPPINVQAVLVASRVNVTGSPEVAVGAGVKVRFTYALAGALKLIP
jgi:hypothetical protein